MPDLWTALLKPYMVNGHPVSAAAIEAAALIMRRDQFQGYQVFRALHANGVPYEASDRAMDRLLQRARKLGLIKHNFRGRWTSIPTAWPDRILPD